MNSLKQVVYKILSLSYDQGFLVTIRIIFDEFVRSLIRKVTSRFIKVDEKKVLFLSFSGNYDCNPKYICQELINQGVDAKIIWGTYKNTRLGNLFFPKEVNYTLRDSFECFKDMASAKVIVDNGISTAWMKYNKKSDQYLIETWHGSIGIKKFGRDSNKDLDWLKLAEKEGQMTDFIISNSDFEDDVYREDFWKDTTIWKFGHPRNDILLCDNEEKNRLTRQKVLDWYEIPEGVKLCMYAPTFRDDGDLSPYDIDYDGLAAALKERFGGDWIIMTRFHARTKKILKNNKIRLPEYVINASGYPDIQELMLTIDVGITDYSSWICEYLVTRKPGFFFATDLDDYANTERTFFMPLSDYPFPVASSEEMLFKNIKEFDNDKFVEDCNQFLIKHGSVDDGHASERVVAEIKKLINA